MAFIGEIGLGGEIRSVCDPYSVLGSFFWYILERPVVQPQRMRETRARIDNRSHRLQTNIMPMGMDGIARNRGKFRRGI